MNPASSRGRMRDSRNSLPTDTHNAVDGLMICIILSPVVQHVKILSIGVGKVINNEINEGSTSERRLCKRKLGVSFRPPKKTPQAMRATFQIYALPAHRVYGCVLTFTGAIKYN